MPKPLLPRSHRGWTFLALAVCVIATAVVMIESPLAARLFEPRFLDQRPYGQRSGAEIRDSWEAERRRQSERYSDADLQKMVDRLFEKDDPKKIRPQPAKSCRLIRF